MSADLPCAEKLTFKSSAEARGSAATLYYQKGTRLKVYKCHHCGLWHLASDYLAKKNN